MLFCCTSTHGEEVCIADCTVAVYAVTDAKDLIVFAGGIFGGKVGENPGGGIAAAEHSLDGSAVITTTQKALGDKHAADPVPFPVGTQSRDGGKHGGRLRPTLDGFDGSLDSLLRSSLSCDIHPKAGA